MTIKTLYMAGLIESEWDRVRAIFFILLDQ